VNIIFTYLDGLLLSKVILNLKRRNYIPTSYKQVKLEFVL